MRHALGSEEWDKGWAVRIGTCSGQCGCGMLWAVGIVTCSGQWGLSHALDSWEFDMLWAVGIVTCSGQWVSGHGLGRAFCFLGRQLSKVPRVSAGARDGQWECDTLWAVVVVIYCAQHDSERARRDFAPTERNMIPTERDAIQRRPSPT